MNLWNLFKNWSNLKTSVWGRCFAWWLRHWWGCLHPTLEYQGSNRSLVADPSFLLTHTERHWVWVEVVEALSPMWETWIDVLAPSLALAILDMCKGNQRIGLLALLSLPPFLPLKHKKHKTLELQAVIKITHKKEWLCIIWLTQYR